jgi:hypothetical protein
MPHATGKKIPSMLTGADFMPDYIPNGIDARGGFILLEEKQGEPGARLSEIFIKEYPVGVRVNFDYTEIESGAGETKPGYYYGVTNLIFEAVAVKPLQAQRRG